MMDINEALTQSREMLLAIDGVLGVGIGKESGEDAIIVIAVHGFDESLLPERISGFKVIVKKSGDIKSLGD